MSIILLASIGYGSILEDNSDETTFNRAYEIRFEKNYLDPKDSRFFNFNFQIADTSNLTTQALLKIFFDQPEPSKYNFILNVDNRQIKQVRAKINYSFKSHL